MRNRLKKAMAFGISLVMGLGLAGCGTEGTEAAAETDEVPAPETESESGAQEPDWSSVSVAFVLPGSANDGSFNSYGYEGYTRLQELGCDAAFSESVTTDEQLGTIRDYAQMGYDIVIGWGAQYDDDMLTVAEEFPDTQFCVVSGMASNDTNLTALYVSCAHMGLAYGYMSAQVSETGKVAFIAANQGNQAYTDEVCGFIEGVKQYDPGYEALILYVQDYSDISEAKEAAKLCVENGCDVMFADISEGYYGMLDIAKENGVKTFGRNADNVATYPDGVITYMENNWGPKMEDFVRAYLTGGMMSGITEIGFGTAVRGWDYIYDEKNAYNPDIMDPEKVEEFQKNVIDRVSEEGWEYSFTAEDANPGIYVNGVPK